MINKRLAFVFAMITAVLATNVAFAEEKVIKVMSYNILSSNWHATGLADWKYRRELVFKTIERASPDVIGLQEVTSTQRDELKRRFGGKYGICWAVHPEYTSVGNAVLYKTNRFLPSGAGCQNSELPNNHAPRTDENPSGLKYRIRVWIELKDSEDQDENAFVFMNTHYTHNPKTVPKTDRIETRKDSSVDIMDFIGEQDVPVIVVGDFNSKNDPVSVPNWWSDDDYVSAGWERSEELCILTDANFSTYGYGSDDVLNNLVWENLDETDIGPNGLIASHYSGNRIDHIFATKGVTASESFLVGDAMLDYDHTLFVPIYGGLITLEDDGDIGSSYPSDHFGIGVNLVLPD